MSDCHVQGYQIVMLCGQIDMLHNYVILKDKNSKKIHNLHMATANLNPQLWIRIYNGFAIIYGFKTNRHSKKPGRF